MNKTFMIAAGGTGGHFYPGYALGAQLRARGGRVIFVIKKGAPSAALLAGAGFEYAEFQAAGAPRGLNPLKWAAFAFKLCGGVLTMRGLIKAFKPDVCAGMGGYVGFPLVFAAHFMGVKTVVHDSNAKIGLANRVLAHFADLFLLGLPTVDKVRNSVLVGTPVRPEFARGAGEGGDVLIFGGSQGARALNLAAAKAAMGMGGLRFTHITGRRDYAEVKEFYGSSPVAEVIDYTEDICNLMAAARVVAARSGASSLAEIIALQKPAVLVPYPHAAGNHQLANAQVLAAAGCALVVEEGPDFAPRLAAAIEAALKNAKQMQAAYATAGLPDPLKAAQKAADLMERL